MCGVNFQLFFAYPSFQRKYGQWIGVTDFTPSGYQLTPAWQAGLSQAAGAGSFTGTLLFGYVVNLFGQKLVILGAFIMMSAGVFIPFFAPNIKVPARRSSLQRVPVGSLRDDSSSIRK